MRKRKADEEPEERTGEDPVLNQGGCQPIGAAAVEEAGAEEEESE